MTEQVGTQFNDDGVQIELDPSYHISAISDAYEAYLTAEDNNKENLFPATYLAQLETPAKFTMDITYPNFSIEDFNDTRSSTWSKVCCKRTSVSMLLCSLTIPISNTWLMVRVQPPAILWLLILLPVIMYYAAVGKKPML